LSTVCFIANDRAFFFRHFKPAIAAAKVRNMKIYAMLPRDGATPLMAATASSDIEVLDSPHDRVLHLWRFRVPQIFWLVLHLRKLKPEIVVAYSLRACVLLSIAQFFVPPRRFVLVITGLGIFELSKSIRSRLARWLVFSIIREAARNKNCHLIFENSSDPKRLGLKAPNDTYATVLMGAGVDPDEFPATSIPAGSPFRFATVSRLVWSKGIDIAARAISELAQEGYPVELDIYGLTDPHSPYPIHPESLSKLPGVYYRGFTDQVADVWKAHHAGIFTSRGGEGLPRALLEAAACGRPSIVTDVPGCSDFIRDGIEGYVVPLNSKEDLRGAILRLICDRDRLELLGTNARNRTLTTSTTKSIQSKYETLFNLDPHYTTVLAEHSNA
jgi:glycosyltransferase involved in cell wall biosynthesis